MKKAKTSKPKKAADRHLGRLVVTIVADTSVFEKTMLEIEARLTRLQRLMRDFGTLPDQR